MKKYSSRCNENQWVVKRLEKKGCGCDICRTDDVRGQVERTTIRGYVCKKNKKAKSEHLYRGVINSVECVEKTLRRMGWG